MRDDQPVRSGLTVSVVSLVWTVASSIAKIPPREVPTNTAATASIAIGQAVVEMAAKGWGWPSS